MEVMVELHAPTSTWVQASVAQASTPEVGGWDVSSSTRQMSLFLPELRNPAPCLVSPHAIHASGSPQHVDLPLRAVLERAAFGDQPERPARPTAAVGR
jgi:hypothetical protein